MSGGVVSFPSAREFWRAIITEGDTPTGERVFVLEAAPPGEDGFLCLELCFSLDEAHVHLMGFMGAEPYRVTYDLREAS